MKRFWFIKLSIVTGEDLESIKISLHFCNLDVTIPHSATDFSLVALTRPMLRAFPVY